MKQQFNTRDYNIKKCCEECGKEIEIANKNLYTYKKRQKDTFVYFCGWKCMSNWSKKKMETLFDYMQRVGKKLEDITLKELIEHKNILEVHRVERNNETDTEILVWFDEKIMGEVIKDFIKNHFIEKETTTEYKSKR